VSGRVGQGGNGPRLAEVDAAQRLPGPSAEVGGGADLRMDLPQPEDGEGLREVMRHRGGIRLRGDEPPHGEAFGPCVGVSRQSL
jgi:hypothetical protein